MKAKQPTQEQIKEFWEWCGFSVKCENDIHYWYDPKGKFYDMHSPFIDLNNLFKYAVPKLKGWTPARDKILRQWLTIFIRDDSDPALALFWAIWEVKDGS